MRTALAVIALASAISLLKLYVQLEHPELLNVPKAQRTNENQPIVVSKPPAQVEKLEDKPIDLSVIWMAPFFTTCGYGTEAIDFVLALDKVYGN